MFSTLPTEKYHTTVAFLSISSRAGSQGFSKASEENPPSEDKTSFAGLVLLVIRRMWLCFVQTCNFLVHPCALFYLFSAELCQESIFQFTDKPFFSLFQDQPATFFPQQDNPQTKNLFNQIKYFIFKGMFLIFSVSFYYYIQANFGKKTHWEIEN